MRFLLLALALLLFTPLARAAAPPLRVGMELGYPPFEMRNAQGEPVGVSVEVARALGEFLGREVRIENIPFDGLILALKTGKIDLIISSMTATPERSRVIDFSEPYLKTGLCLLVGAGSEIDGIAAADRAGKTVAVKKGTTGELYAVKSLKSARMLVLDKENSAVIEVVQGKADAFIYDQMSVYQHWRQHPEETKALLEPFKAEEWAVGIAKGNDELRTKVNAFLEKYRAEGGFEKLGDRFLKEQKEAFGKLGIPFFF